jgi:hypothetical protein
MVVNCPEFLSRGGRLTAIFDRGMRGNQLGLHPEFSLER